MGYNEQKFFSMMALTNIVTLDVPLTVVQYDYLTSVNASWSLARNATSADAGSSSNYKWDSGLGAVYGVDRSIVLTGAYGTSGTVKSVQLYLKRNNVETQVEDAYLFKRDSTSAAVPFSDFSNFSTQFSDRTSVGSDYMVFNFNAAGISYVAGQSNASFVVRGWQDVEDSAPGGSVAQDSFNIGQSFMRIKYKP